MERVQKDAGHLAPYDIEISSEAKRSLDDSPITKENKRMIADAIDRLELEPRPENSLRLVTGENLRRLTVGDYRVVYGIDENARKIVIERIRHREQAYDELVELAKAVKGKYSR